MSASNISPRTASIAAALIALVALVLLVGVAGRTADAATKCSTPQKKKGACPKTSKRISYKTVRTGRIVDVPYTPSGTGESEIVAINCPRAEHVLAGGVSIAEPAAPFLTVSLSAPNETATGWSGQLTNLSTTAYSEAWISIYAVCEVSPTPKAS